MLQKARKTWRARTGEDAARIWNRFMPAKGSRGQPPPTTRQSQPQGRPMPPAELIRGKR